MFGTAPRQKLLGAKGSTTQFVCCRIRTNSCNRNDNYCPINSVYGCHNILPGRVDRS